jgi:ClpP class serine protease
MWFLTTAVREQIERAMREGHAPTAEQRAVFAASFGPSESGPRLLTVAKGKATISVSGVLTRSPNWIAAMFGGGNTTYSDIIAALAAADSNPDVVSGELCVSSPGGEVQGLFETVDAVRAFSKPLRGVVGGQAASAAYGLISQCGEIVASSRASAVGSIGVKVEASVDPTSVTITSTNAPNKAPDVTTAEGVAAVRAELDAYHDLFAEAIAQGRGTTVAAVNADFGRGGILLADAALKAGMIDSIAQPPQGVVKSAVPKPKTPKSESRTMDLKQLKAEHEDVYALAVADGVAQERDRVTAHLIGGQASGLLTDAIKACEEGTAFSTSASAKYMMAAVNKREGDNRIADDTAASAALARADQGAPSAETEAQQVLKGVLAHLGTEVGA